MYDLEKQNNTLTYESAMYQETIQTLKKISHDQEKALDKWES